VNFCDFYVYKGEIYCTMHRRNQARVTTRQCGGQGKCRGQINICKYLANAVIQFVQLVQCESVQSNLIYLIYL